MKHVLALLVGILVGAVTLALLLYMNPFVTQNSVSPLAVSAGDTLSLGFTRVPSEAVLYTNNGDQTSAPFPQAVDELWEPTIRRSRVTVVELHNGRGLPVGVGVKFSSDSEETDVLNAQAVVDSAWHIYLPDRGSLLIGQQENLWAYLREIVAKARWSSKDGWRGAWSGVLTSGPNAIGTGRVFGGSGEFSGLQAEAVETLSASAYSADRGPVAMDGSLTISLPSELPR